MVVDKLIDIKQEVNIWGNQKFSFGMSLFVG